MSQPKIIKFAPTPYSNLARAVDAVLAEHPESDDLTQACRRIAHLMVELETFEPSYAEALMHVLQRRLRRHQRLSMHRYQRARQP